MNRINIMRAVRSEVGGLLPVATPEKNGLMSKDGFINRGLISSVSLYPSFNSMIKNGFYFISASYSGELKPANLDSGFLIVYNHEDSLINQSFMDRYSSIIYRRIYESGKWGDWVKVN